MAKVLGSSLVNRILVPSGDHTGKSSHAPSGRKHVEFVMFRKPVPSALTVKRSRSGRSMKNTSREPSGDQLGAWNRMSSRGSEWVSRVSPVPSGRIVKTSKFPRSPTSWKPMNAIRLPSGDHAGKLPRVSSVRPLPSAFITLMRTSNGEEREADANAIFDPSADHVSEVTSLKVRCSSVFPVPSAFITRMADPDRINRHAQGHRSGRAARRRFVARPATTGAGSQLRSGRRSG